MLLTYQYRLQPTLLQGATLNHWGELLRRTRPHLNRCSLTSEPIGDIPSNVDYSADLTETKGLFPEYKEIYTDCQQQNGMGLDKSWKGWSIPDKTGKKGGKPRFQKQGDICSFTFPRVNSSRAGLHLVDGMVKLSKIGEIPVVLHRPILDGFPIKQATIVSKADGWYVSFAIEDTTARQRKDFQYSVAHYLCIAYDRIGFEKLNIKGLARTRLAQSILHVPWQTFLTIVPAVGVKRSKHPQEVDARSRSIQCCEKSIVKDLSIPVQDCPNGGISLDRDLNANLNLLKRTVGQPFAAGGGLVDAQSVRQELSFVNLGSPVRPLLAVDGGICHGKT